MWGNRGNTRMHSSMTVNKVDNILNIVNTNSRRWRLYSLLCFQSYPQQRGEPSLVNWILLSSMFVKMLRAAVRMFSVWWEKTSSTSSSYLVFTLDVWPWKVDNYFRFNTRFGAAFSKIISSLISSASLSRSRRIKCRVSPTVNNWLVTGPRPNPCYLYKSNEKEKWDV